MNYFEDFEETFRREFKKLEEHWKMFVFRKSISKKKVSYKTEIILNIVILFNII